MRECTKVIKFIMKHQSFPKSRKLDSFEQKYENVTALFIINSRDQILLP